MVAAENQIKSKKGRYKPMKKTRIEGIGIINVEGLEATAGQLEMRVPVEVISQQLSKTLDELFAKFQKAHPKVASENIAFEARLVFSFNYYNPEFSLTLIVFDAEDQDIVEIWDELEVTLSEDARKQFRKIAWDKLGEALFNL